MLQPMKNLLHEPEGLSLFPQNPTQKGSVMVYSCSPRPGGTQDPFLTCQAKQITNFSPPDRKGSLLLEQPRVRCENYTLCGVVMTKCV